MSDFAGFTTVILAGIVHASLQFAPATLLLLYHSSMGKNISAKTRQLASSFISGVGIIVFLFLATSCFVVANIFNNNTLLGWLLYVLVGVLAALAIVMWFFYYRYGATTELWLPKVFTGFVQKRAKITNDNTEAFSLGILASFAELPISAVLILIAANSILEIQTHYQLLAIAIYTIIITVPLLIFRIAIRSGRSTVDIQKWRVRNKLFLRVISGFSFLALAAYLFVFKIVGVV